MLTVMAAVREPGETVRIRLVDVARLAGLDFVHDGGRSDRMLLTDTIGSGGTLFDADGDGDMDLFLVTGNALDPSARPRSRNALFVNDGSGQFERRQAGVEADALGMGVVSFDYDGDGHQDLYVTNRGPNRLYRNRGDGTFEDVTSHAGVGDDRWSAGAAAADYDGDGDLDLFVANYIDYDVARHRILQFGPFVLAAGPNFYDGEPDALYRNDGDGTFTEVARRAGVEGVGGRSLGVAFVDLDGDLDPDLFVANDTTPDFLYRNDGDGRFTDVAVEAGVAVGPAGTPESGMGVAVGDYDNDGLIDVLVTNFSQETNALYRNRGGLEFDRVEDGAGIGGASFRPLGFGCDFVDVDDDGDLDLLVANGHISVHAERFPPTAQEYAQRSQLFVNDGSGRFAEAGTAAGEFFGRRFVARGTIPGDVDGDGDLDVVMTTVDGPPLLLQNVAPAGHERAGAFLAVALDGMGKNHDGIGARVEVTAAGRRQVQVARAGSSYLCDADPRLHFGLGDADRASVRVVWRSGRVSELGEVAANRVLRVRESEAVVEEVGSVAAASAGLALVGVRLAGDGDDVRRTVHVGGDRIVAVDDRGASPAERGVDLDGATVIPAFIDAHVHMAYCDAAAMMRQGVGATIDLGSPSSLWQAGEGRYRPLLVRFAGPILTVPGGFPTKTDWGHEGFGEALADVAAARAKVDELADRGVALVKIALSPEDGPMLPRAMREAIVTRAHARGLRVAAHAMSAEGVAAAVAAGVDILAHAPESPLDESSAARFCSRPGAAVIPTLRAFFARPAARENLRRLWRAGCTVLYGTDPGNRAAAMLGMARPDGIDVAELRLYVEAGMSPAEAIASATSVPARYFGLSELGSVAPGARASLVVVARDPTADLEVLAHPAMVIVGGEVLVSPDGLRP